MEDNVVVINSDSDEDETKISVKNAKLISFKRLWDKSNAIVFHHLSSNYKLEFPYVKFKNFYIELKKTLSEISLESTRSFIWQNLIQWLIAMKLSYSGIVDLKFDEKFNFILIDFMAQYINYKCKLNIKLYDDYEIQKEVNEILDILGIMFSGNSQFIVMTLLKIDVTEEYTNILNPIFSKYLSDKFAHKSKELISYIQLILCYKQWKKLAKCKEDREAINEIAVGKSTKALNKSCNDKFTNIPESILPRCVPTIDDNNRSFTTISDLIGHAIQNGNFGTRILLIKKSLDLDEAIEKYFIQYERYINRFDPTSLCNSTNLLSLNDIVAKTNKFDNIHKTTKFDENRAHEKLCTSPQQKQHAIYNRQPSLLGKQQEQQHLSNVCDINHKLSNINNNNNRLLDNKLLNYKRNINNRSVVSRKNINNNQNCDHNIIEDIIEIDTTDNSSEENDDNIKNSTDTIKKNYSKKSVPYKKSQQSKSKNFFRNNTTGNLLNDNSNNSLETVQTILLLSSSDEDDNKIECTGVDKFLTNNNSNDSRCSSRNSSIPSESENAQPETATNKIQQNLIQSPPKNNINMNSLSPTISILPPVQNQRINNRFSNLNSPTNTRDRGNTTVNIKKLEKQRCIPGEVSSTTLLDFTISDQNDIAIASTSSAVEVHSASANYETVRNIREVGNIIKVNSPSTSQFKNRFGNHNSIVSNKSLNYSDVSSSEDDDTDEFSITRNLYSRIPKKYIREIEKAISSTSEINHTKVNCTSSRNYIENANIESSQNEKSENSLLNQQNNTIPKQAEKIQFSFTNNTKSNKESVLSKSNNKIDILNKNEVNSLAVIPYASVTSSFFINPKEKNQNSVNKQAEEVFNSNNTTNEISNQEIVYNESFNNANNGINNAVFTINNETPNQLSLCRPNDEVPSEKTENLSNKVHNSNEKLKQSVDRTHIKLNEEININSNLTTDNTSVDKTFEESLSSDNKLDLNNLDNTKSEEINEKQINKIDKSLEFHNNNKICKKSGAVKSQKIEKKSEELPSKETSDKTARNIMITENIPEKLTPDKIKIDQNLLSLITPPKLSTIFSICQTNDTDKNKKCSDETLQQLPLTEHQDSKPLTIKTSITKTHKPLKTYSKQLIQKLIFKPNLLTNKESNNTVTESRLKNTDLMNDVHTGCEPKATTVIKEKQDVQIDCEPKSMVVITDTPTKIIELSTKEPIKENYDAAKKRESLTERVKPTEVKESFNEKVDPLLKNTEHLTNKERNYNKSEKPLKTYSKKSTFIRRVHKIFDDKTFFKKYSKHSTTIKIIQQEMKNPQNAKQSQMKKPLKTYNKAKLNHIPKKSEDEFTDIELSSLEPPILQPPLLEPLNIDLQTENFFEKSKDIINCELNFDIKELTGIVNSPQKFENEKLLGFDDNTEDTTGDMEIFDKNLESENKISGDLEKNSEKGSSEVNKTTKEIDIILDNNNKNISKNNANDENSSGTLCHENALSLANLFGTEKTHNKNIEMVITDNDSNLNGTANNGVNSISDISTQNFLLEVGKKCEDIAVSKFDNASAKINTNINSSEFSFANVQPNFKEYMVESKSAEKCEEIIRNVIEKDDQLGNSIQLKQLESKTSDEIKVKDNTTVSTEENENTFEKLAKLESNSEKSKELVCGVSKKAVQPDKIKKLKLLEAKDFKESDITVNAVNIVERVDQLNKLKRVEEFDSTAVEKLEKVVNDVIGNDKQLNISVKVDNLVKSRDVEKFDINVNTADIVERDDQLDKLESLEELDATAYEKLEELVYDEENYKLNNSELKELESKIFEAPEIKVNSTDRAESSNQLDKSESLVSPAVDKLEEAINNVIKQDTQVNNSEKLDNLKSKASDEPVIIINTPSTAEKITKLDNCEKLDNIRSKDSDEPVITINSPSTAEKITKSDNYEELDNLRSNAFEEPAITINSPSTAEKITKSDNCEKLDNLKSKADERVITINSPSIAEKITKSDNCEELDNLRSNAFEEPAITINSPSIAEKITKSDNCEKLDNLKSKADEPVITINSPSIAEKITKSDNCEKLDNLKSKADEPVITINSPSTAEKITKLDHSEKLDNLKSKADEPVITINSPSTAEKITKLDHSEKLDNLRSNAFEEPAITINSPSTAEKITKLDNSEKLDNLKSNAFEEPAITLNSPSTAEKIIKSDNYEELDNLRSKASDERVITINSPSTAEKITKSDNYEELDNLTSKASDEPVITINSPSTAEKITKLDNSEKLDNLRSKTSEEPAITINSPSTAEKITKSDNCEKLDNLKSKADEPVITINSPSTAEKITKSDNYEKLDNLRSKASDEPVITINSPSTAEKITKLDNCEKLDNLKSKADERAITINSPSITEKITKLDNSEKLDNLRSKASDEPVITINSLCITEKITELDNSEKLDNLRSKASSDEPVITINSLCITEKITKSDNCKKLDNLKSKADERAITINSPSITEKITKLDNSEKLDNLRSKASDEPVITINSLCITEKITKSDNCKKLDNLKSKADERAITINSPSITEKIIKLDNSEKLDNLRSKASDEPVITINSLCITEKITELDNSEKLDNLRSKASSDEPVITINSLCITEKITKSDNCKKLDNLKSKADERAITINSPSITEKIIKLDNSEKLDNLTSKASDEPVITINSACITEKITKLVNSEYLEKLESIPSNESETDATEKVCQLDKSEKLEKIESTTFELPEEIVMLNATVKYSDKSEVMVGTKAFSEKDDQLDNSKQDIVESIQEKCANVLLSDKIIESDEVSEKTNRGVTNLLTEVINDNCTNNLNENNISLFESATKVQTQIQTVSTDISNSSKENSRLSSEATVELCDKRDDLQESIIDNSINQNKAIESPISVKEVSTEIISNELQNSFNLKDKVKSNYKITQSKPDTKNVLVEQSENENLNDLDKTQRLNNSLLQKDLVETNVDLERGKCSDFTNNFSPEKECQNLVEKSEDKIKLSSQETTANILINQENNNESIKELCPTIKIQHSESEPKNNSLVENTKSHQPKIILEMFDEILDVPLTPNKKLEQEISNYQNTPFKLRIKRRLSQCANKNEIFDSTNLQQDSIETQKSSAEILTKSNALDNSTNENEMMTSLLNRIDEILDEKEQTCKINPKQEKFSKIVTDKNEIKENLNNKTILNSEYSLKTQNSEIMQANEENIMGTKEVWMKTIGLGKTTSIVCTDDYLDSDSTYNKICGRRKKSRCIKRLSSLEEIENNNIDTVTKDTIQNGNIESDPFHDVVIPMENFVIQNDNNENLVRSNFELLLEAAKLVCDKKNENISCQKVPNKKKGRPKKQSIGKNQILPARSTRLSCSILEKEGIETNVHNALILPKKSVIRNPNINQPKKYVRFRTPDSDEILLPEKTLEFIDSIDYSDIINFVNKKKRKKFTKNNLHIDTKKLNKTNDEDENLPSIKNDNTAALNLTNLNSNCRAVSPTSSNSTDSDDFGKLVIDIPEKTVTKTTSPSIKGNKTKTKKQSLKNNLNKIEQLSDVEKCITQEKFILPPPVINYDDGLLMVNTATPCQNIYEEVEAELIEQRQTNENKTKEFKHKQITTSIIPSTKLLKANNQKYSKAKVRTSPNIVHLTSEVISISLCGNNLSENFENANWSANQMSPITISPSKENAICYGSTDECELMYPIIELSETDDILNIGGSEYSSKYSVKKNQIQSLKKDNKKSSKKNLIAHSTEEIEITLGGNDKKKPNIFNVLDVINQSKENLVSSNKNESNKKISTSRKLSTDHQICSNQKLSNSETNFSEIGEKDLFYNKNSNISSTNHIGKDFKSSCNKPKSQNKSEVKNLTKSKIRQEELENFKHEDQEKNVNSVKSFRDLKLKTIQLTPVTGKNEKTLNQDEVVKLQHKTNDNSKDLTSQAESQSCKPSKNLKEKISVNLINKCDEKINLKEANSNLEKDEKIINKNVFPVQILRSHEQEKICYQKNLQVTEITCVSNSDAKKSTPFIHPQEVTNISAKQDIPMKSHTKADLDLEEKLTCGKSKDDRSVVETKPKNNIENILEETKKSISRPNQKSQPKLGKDINSISNKLLEIASHEDAYFKYNLDKKSRFQGVRNNIANTNSSEKILTGDELKPKNVKDEKLIQKPSKSMNEKIKNDNSSVESSSPINREVLKPSKFDLGVQPVALLKVQNILDDNLNENSNSETILGKIESYSTNSQQIMINKDKKPTENKKEFNSSQNIDLLNHEKKKILDNNPKNKEKYFNKLIQTSQLNSCLNKDDTKNKKIDTDISKNRKLSREVSHQNKPISAIEKTVTDQIINTNDIISTNVPATNDKKFLIKLNNAATSTIKPLVDKQLKTNQDNRLEGTLTTKSSLRKSKDKNKLSRKSINIRSCLVDLSPFLHDPIIIQKKNEFGKIKNVCKLLDNTDTNIVKPDTLKEMDATKILKKKNLISFPNNQNKNISQNIAQTEIVDVSDISKKESINSSEITNNNNQIACESLIHKEDSIVTEISEPTIISLEIEPINNLNSANEKDSLNNLQEKSLVEFNNDSTKITTPSDYSKNTESTTILQLPFIGKSVEKDMSTEIINSNQKDKLNIISDTEKDSLDCSESIESSHMETGENLLKLNSMISQIKEITDAEVNVESEINMCSQNEKELPKFVSHNNKVDNKIDDNTVKETDEEIQPDKLITENDLNNQETISKSIEYSATPKPQSNIKTTNYISSELTFCNMPENIFDGGSDNSNSSEYNKITLSLKIPPINEIINPLEYQLNTTLDEENCLNQLNKRNSLKRKRKHRRLSSNKKTRLQNISNEELRKIAENKKCFIKLTRYETFEELRQQNKCNREESHIQNELFDKKLIVSPNNSPTSPSKSYESDSDTSSVISNEDIHSTILNVQKQLDNLKDLRFSTNDNVTDTSLTEITAMNTPFKNSVEDISFDTRLTSFDFSTSDWCSDTILDSITKDLTGHHEYSTNNKGDYMISGKVPENSLGLRGIICPLIDSDITNFVQLESDEIDVNNINTTASSINQAVNMNLILNESVISSKQQHQQQEQQVLKNNLENSDELLNYLGNVNTINPDDFLNPIETNDNYQFRTDVGFDFHDNALYDLDILIDNNSKILPINQKTSIVNKNSTPAIKNYSVCNNNFNTMLHSTPKKDIQLQKSKLITCSSDSLLIDKIPSQKQNDPTKKYVNEFFIPEKDLAEASSSKSNSNNLVEEFIVLDENNIIQEKEVSSNNNSIEKQKNEEQINTIEKVKCTNQQSTFDQLKSDCITNSTKTPTKSENKLKSDSSKEKSISNRRKSLAELKLSISDKLANNLKASEKCQTPRTPESKLKSYPTPSWKVGNMKKDKNQSPQIKAQLSFVEKQSPSADKQTPPVIKQSPIVENQTLSVEESNSTTTMLSTTSLSNIPTTILSTTSTISIPLSSSYSIATSNSVSKDRATKSTGSISELVNPIDKLIENGTAICTKVNVMTISASPTRTTVSTITNNKSKTLFHMPFLDLPTTTTNDSFKKVKPLIKSPNVTAIPKNLPQFNAEIITPKVVIDFIPVVKKCEQQNQPSGNIKRSNTETNPSDIPLKRKVIESGTSSTTVDIFDQLKNEPPVNNVQMKLNQCKNIVVTLPKNMSSSPISTTVNSNPIQNSITKTISNNANTPTISNFTPSPTTKSQINSPLAKSPIVSSKSGQYTKFEMDKIKYNNGKGHNQYSYRNPNITQNFTSSPTIKTPTLNSPKLSTTTTTSTETQQIKHDKNTNPQLCHYNKNPAFKSPITKPNATPSSIATPIKPPTDISTTKIQNKIEQQTNKIPATIIKKPIPATVAATSINKQQKEPILNTIDDIKTAIENLPEPKTYGQHRQRQQLLKQLEEQNLKRKAESDAKILAEKQRRFENRYKNHQQQKHHHHHHHQQQHKFNNSQSHNTNSTNKTKSSSAKPEYVNLFSKLSENSSSNIYLSKLSLNQQNKNSDTNKVKPLTIPTEWEYRQVNSDELIAHFLKQKK